MNTIGNPTVEEDGTMIYWPDEALLNLMGPKECGWKIHATKDLDRCKSEVFDCMEPHESIYDYLYGYMDWDSVMDARSDLHLYCVAVMPERKFLNKAFKDIQIVGYFSWMK